MKSLVLAFVLLGSSSFAQHRWYVDVGGVAPGSGTASDPYTSLQFAISQPATVSGDTLLVAPGIYYETIDYLGKGVIVESAAGPERTTIDAQGLEAGVSMIHAEPEGTALIGFTVTHGAAYSNLGGGVVCVGATVTIENCVFRDCKGWTKGGGVYCSRSTLTARDCTFTSNFAAREGGGIYAELSTIEAIACKVTDNLIGVLSNGGGIYLSQCTAFLAGCEISRNRCNQLGNGIGLTATGCNLSIVDSTIADNSSGDDCNGIGLSISGGDATLLRSIVRGNHGNATFDGTRGGGLIVGGGSFQARESLFLDNRATVGGGAIVGADRLVLSPAFSWAMSQAVRLRAR